MERSRKGKYLQQLSSKRRPGSVSSSDEESPRHLPKYHDTDKLSQILARRGSSLSRINDKSSRKTVPVSCKFIH